MVAGIIGVPTGALLSTKLKLKFPRADPVICGTGLVITTFLFFLSLLWAAEMSTIAAMAFIFFGMISLNLNWSIVADMLLYVVAPTRRYDHLGEGVAVLRAVVALRPTGESPVTHRPREELLVLLEQ